MKNVLDILSENFNQTVSGEKIAQMLNISRNAVWKQINQLKKQGIRIDTEKNGYKLTEDVLCKSQIEKYTSADVTVFDSLDSTNTYLKNNNKDYADKTVVIARKQTSGRGRMGRTFISPERGIYMSILIKKDIPAEQALSLTTVCGVAVALAIEKIAGKEAKIKWVNDIFVDGKKVCGILTEAGINVETSMIDYAVVGIGVNVYMPKSGIDSSIKDIAGYLLEEMNGNINLLAAEIINNFFRLYQSTDYIEEYRKRSFLDGKNIEYVFEGETRNGKVIGVDEKCGLVVEQDGKTETLRTGEVHIINYDKE